MSPTRKHGDSLACASGSCSVRAGLTLLEVIISLAIFLFSMVALLHLLSQSGQNALDGSLHTEATLRCQSKLAEIMNGAVPMSSSGWSAFEEARTGAGRRIARPANTPTCTTCKSASGGRNPTARILKSA